MRSLLRLLLWLTVTLTVWWPCSRIAVAQSRVQQESRLTDLKGRFERLLTISIPGELRRVAGRSATRTGETGSRVEGSMNEEPPTSTLHQ